MPAFRYSLINEYNQVVQDLSVFHKLPVIPPNFYEHFSAPVNHDRFFDDVHPNGDGYIDMAQMWYDALLTSGLLD